VLIPVFALGRAQELCIVSVVVCGGGGGVDDDDDDDCSTGENCCSHALLLCGVVD